MALGIEFMKQYLEDTHVGVVGLRPEKQCFEAHISGASKSKKMQENRAKDCKTIDHLLSWYGECCRNFNNTYYNSQMRLAKQELLERFVKLEKKAG